MSPLKDMLANSFVLIDTSFVMQDGFIQFLNETYFSQGREMFKPIYVPRTVRDELNRHSKQRTLPEKSLAAARGIKGLLQLIKIGKAKICGEKADVGTIADAVILRVVMQFRMKTDIAVLTNDVALMKDLFQICDQGSVRTRKKIAVWKIHGERKKVVPFYPSGTDVPSARKENPGNPSPKRPDSAVSSNQASRSTKKQPAPNSSAKPSLGFRTKSGTPIQLGRSIGEGGEGKVYEISDRAMVCKIYFERKLTTDLRQKLELMVKKNVTRSGVCWPQELVYDEQGQFRGYTMAKADGMPLGNTLFYPESFPKTHPNWTRLDSTNVAIDIAEKIKHLHLRDIILGDINPQNILITDDRCVFFVDCDSYQIGKYPCTVGTVNFTAPEIQGKQYDSFLRSTHNELFAVATLLFMIFVPGKTPYSHTGGEGGKSNIEKGVFSYTADWNEKDGRAPPGRWMYCWGHLSPWLMSAFDQSFNEKTRHKSRVSLEDWLFKLRNYRQLLNDPSNTFRGKGLHVGYDLSIMPDSKRFRSREDFPYNGLTGIENQLKWLKTQKRPPLRSSTAEKSPSTQKPTSPRKDKGKKKKKRMKKNQDGKMSNDEFLQYLIPELLGILFKGVISLLALWLLFAVMNMLTS